VIEQPAAKTRTLEQFDAELATSGLKGFWRIETRTSEPRTAVQPYVWRWPTLRRHLEQARGLIHVDRSAERRALQLINPGLSPRSATTHSFVTAVQLIKPGDVAPTHRHTPTAIRFIVAGHGAYTTVEGEQLIMEEGDLILTPNWTWHDHGNESDGEVVWLDGLDVPLVLALDAYFFESYHQERQPVAYPRDDSTRRYGAQLRPFGHRQTSVVSPQRAYRWRDTYATLAHLAALGEADPYDDVAVEYLNPTTGGHALPTLGCAMQLLRPGSRTRAHRHTSSAVYQVFRGEGYSVVNGQRLSWAQGDIFALPPWAWHEHANASKREEAILFSINDVPVLEALALYRDQDYPEHDGHQPEGKLG
jgi:gentisate 1,2-dioxygenase